MHNLLAKGISAGRRRVSFLSGALAILAAPALADPPKDGKHVETWADGKPKLEAHYKDFKLNHDNGKVHYRGLWKDELQEGQREWFRPDETKSEVRLYKGGQLHGWVMTWDEKGKVTSREARKNGKRKK